MGRRLAYTLPLLAGWLLCASSSVRGQQEAPAPSPLAQEPSPTVGSSLPGDVAPAQGAAVEPAATAPAPVKAGTFALHWVRAPGAEDCVAGDALARDVEGKLGRVVFPAPRDATTLIEGQVTRTRSGYDAVLRMSEGGGRQLGSRALSSERSDCGELSETIAVVLAVMIDPDAAGRVKGLESSTTAPAQTASSERPMVGDDNRMAVFARLLLGVSDRVGVGLGAAYERALGRWGGVRIEGVGFLENRVGAPSGITGSSVRFHVAYAGAAYCPLWWSYARLRLLGCAGVELGLVRVHADGFPSQLKDKGVWGSGSANVRLSLRLARALEAHFGAGLLVPFGDQLNVQNADGTTSDPIFPRQLFAGAFDLGLGARF